MNIRDLAELDQDLYFKIVVNEINIYFHPDAYFMINNFSKLTIALTHSTYGDFLTIKEFDPSLN